MSKILSPPITDGLKIRLDATTPISEQWPPPEFASSTSTVGNDIIARTAADTATTTYLVAQALPTNTKIMAWSFYGHTGTQSRQITPLLWELSSGTLYTLKAIGNTVTTSSSNTHFGYIFEVISGNANVTSGSYYFGWKDGSPTASNAGLISYAATGGSVEIKTLTGSASTNLVNINETMDFGTSLGSSRIYSVNAWYDAPNATLTKNSYTVSGYTFSGDATAWTYTNQGTSVFVTSQRPNMMYALPYMADASKSSKFISRNQYNSEDQFTANFGGPAYVQYTFPLAVKVTSFKIQSSALAYTLLGSNDGSTYTTLFTQTRSGSIGSVPTYPPTLKTHPRICVIQTPGYYKIYRLSCTYVMHPSYPSAYPTNELLTENNQGTLQLKTFVLYTDTPVTGNIQQMIVNDNEPQTVRWTPNSAANPAYWFDASRAQLKAPSPWPAATDVLPAGLPTPKAQLDASALNLENGTTVLSWGVGEFAAVGTTALRPAFRKIQGYKAGNYVSIPTGSTGYNGPTIRVPSQQFTMGNTETSGITCVCLVSDIGVNSTSYFSLGDQATRATDGLYINFRQNDGNPRYGLTLEYNGVNYGFYSGNLGGYFASIFRVIGFRLWWTNGAWTITIFYSSNKRTLGKAPWQDGGVLDRPTTLPEIASPITKNLYIGQCFRSDHQMSGVNVKEWLVFDSALTDAQIDSLGTYLTKKWEPNFTTPIRGLGLLDSSNSYAVGETSRTYSPATTPFTPQWSTPMSRVAVGFATASSQIYTVTAPALTTNALTIAAVFMFDWRTSPALSFLCGSPGAKASGSWAIGFSGGSTWTRYANTRYIRHGATWQGGLNSIVGGDEIFFTTATDSSDFDYNALWPAKILTFVDDGATVSVYKPTLAGNGLVGNATHTGAPLYNVGTEFTLGANHLIFGSSASLGGMIAEVVVYPFAMGDADRQKLEGYLSKKWNVAVHASHPYGTRAPTFVLRSLQSTGTGNAVQTFNSTRELASGPSGNTVQIAATSPTTAIECSVFAVLRPTASSATRILSTTTGPLVGLAESLQGITFGASASIAAASPLVVKNKVMVEVLANTTTVQAFADGVSLGSASKAATVFDVSNIIANVDTVDISEVLVYDKVLSESQRVQTEGYLAWKHSLPLPSNHAYVTTQPARRSVPTNIVKALQPAYWFEASGALRPEGLQWPSSTVPVTPWLSVDAASLSQTYTNNQTLEIGTTLGNATVSNVGSSTVRPAYKNVSKTQDKPFGYIDIPVGPSSGNGTFLDFGNQTLNLLDGLTVSAVMRGWSGVTGQVGQNYAFSLFSVGSTGLGEGNTLIKFGTFTTTDYRFYCRVEQNEIGYPNSTTKSNGYISYTPSPQFMVITVRLAQSSPGKLQATFRVDEASKGYNPSVVTSPEFTPLYTDLVNTPLAIARNPGDNFFGQRGVGQCTFNEVLVYKTSLSDTDISTVHAYLKQKWIAPSLSIIKNPGLADSTFVLGTHNGDTANINQSPWAFPANFAPTFIAFPGAKAQSYSCAPSSVPANVSSWTFGTTLSPMTSNAASGTILTLGTHSNILANLTHISIGDRAFTTPSGANVTVSGTQARFATTFNRDTYPDFAQKVLLVVTDTGTSVEVYRDGYLVGNCLYTNSLAQGIPHLSVSAVRIGNGGNASADASYGGAIGEVLVMGSALSSENRQKLEGFLAKKWTISLVAGHPYANVQTPKIQNTSLVNYTLDYLASQDSSIPKTASGMYSVKRLVGSYSGPVMAIRRDSDNVVADVYADYTGSSLTLANATTLVSWLGGSTPRVQTMYNQNTAAFGNVHLVQSTSANQPFYDLSKKSLNARGNLYLEIPGSANVSPFLINGSRSALGSFLVGSSNTHPTLFGTANASNVTETAHDLRVFVDGVYGPSLQIGDIKAYSSQANSMASYANVAMVVGTRETSNATSANVTLEAYLGTSNILTRTASTTSRTLPTDAATLTWKFPGSTTTRVDSAANVSITTVTGGTSFRCNTPLAAPNGKVYFIPFGGTNLYESVVVYDPLASSFATLSLTASAKKWVGGATVGNNVYAIPFDAAEVLVIDTITNVRSLVTVQSSGQNALAGGCVGPNGRDLYGCPFSAASVLVFNTSTNTYSTISVSAGTSKWYGAALADNGCIYCAPFNASTVLKITCATNSVTYLTHPTMATSTGKFMGAVKAGNGNVYFIPSSATQIMELDPTNDSMTLFGSATGYAFGTLAPNGLLYCPGTTNALIIDPYAKTHGTLSLPEGKQAGAVLHPDGTIYTAPSTAGSIGIITPAQTVPSNGDVYAWDHLIFSSRLSTKVYNSLRERMWQTAGLKNTSSQEAIPTSGLVLHLDAFKYSSGDGTTWKSLVGSTNATLYNAPTHSYNRFKYDGTTQYCTIPSVSGVTDFTDTYTVSFWFYANATQLYTLYGDNDIVEKWENAGAYPYVFRWIRGTPMISFGMYNGSSGIGIDSQTLTADTWHHVVGITDRTQSLMALYVNGVLQGTKTPVTGTINNSSPLYLMRRGSVISNYATGQLALLQIYSRALSASEVLQLYTAHRPRFYG